MACIIEGPSVTYKTFEYEFIKYFDRLYYSNYSFDEIKINLPYLEKQYNEIISDNLDFVSQIYYPKLNDLFKKWKYSKKY